MEQMIFNAVCAVGFPIVVTLYLLTSFKESMDKFTDKLGEFIQELNRCEK
ncbi:YvrJ family protein [Selenomonas sp. AE3005]|nr:YvrJ family protein [Selenomonas sp. AE3005]